MTATTTQDSAVRRAIVDGIIKAHEDALVDGHLTAGGVPAPSFGMMADAAIAALLRADVTLVQPDDLSWGECPEASGWEGEPAPHIVSLSLCSGCLQYDPD